MYPAFRRLPLVFCLLAILTVCGCGWFGGTKKAVIDKALAALEAQKAELLASQRETLQTVNFRKDAEGDGIVIEYVYREGMQFDESMNSESAKTGMIAQFKNNEGIKSVLGYGIYLKFVFKSAEGETLAETKIDANDL